MPHQYENTILNHGNDKDAKTIFIIQRCKTALLKSHFGMGVLLYSCCIFSEHLLLRTPPGGCFWILICKSEDIFPRSPEIFELLQYLNFWMSRIPDESKIFTFLCVPICLCLFSCYKYLIINCLNKSLTLWVQWKLEWKHFIYT